ncbi:hypothetical protein GH714_041941 [Hevea brasiliensis]|uniref:K Homology domain-containing protein n=1 Tax=Hevea brasiliensis TaxID=3981 RepID=A0A6A6MSS2_HEVBR|nr:hypothetical protein GH714_041941 [Hevea brasiliensis]
MGEPEHEQQHQNEQKEFADGGKRKLDAFELAKQRAQEIASRIASDADPKRPRIVTENSSEPSFSSIPFAAQPSLYSQGTSKKITIPNGKVGVVIGKGGETIKHIQLQSGAKIQITKDQDANPHSLTRDVELMGTSEQISRAEELINDVITETDVGGSGSSAVHGLNTKQSGAEQFAMKVPNDKVGLLIGKGGETIKYMQGRSGARMQIIPLHLPPGDTSAERTVYINGSTEQIETAKELVNDVISGKRIISPSESNSYAQPVYPAASNWVQPGQPTVQQQPQYGYAQPGTQPTPSSYYGNYTQQPSWDQLNPSTMSQTPQQTTGYGYYGQPQMGSDPLNPSYSYNQTPPVASKTYDHSYNGAVSSQSTRVAPPAYPPTAYSQSVANPQTYWNSSSYTGQQPQTVYDQTGYSQTYGGQTAYGGMQPGQVPPPSTWPIYGQGGYPLPESAAAANYVQETQPQSQPSNNGHSQSLAYGAETHDGNSNPAVQEAVPSQS